MTVCYFYRNVKMATSLLRLGRAGALKLESWGALRRAPAAALCTKSGEPKKPAKKTSIKKTKTKTYFDIEKLTQHRAYVEFPKKESASAEAAAAAVAGTAGAEPALPAAEPAPPAPETPAVAEASAPADTATPIILLTQSSCPAPSQLDPIQKLFLDKIREYSAKSRSSGGLVDAGPEYQRSLSEESPSLKKGPPSEDHVHPCFWCLSLFFFFF
ncbi:hypothetical protein JZ751_012718, partial [Albula glossodonta]